MPTTGGSADTLTIRAGYGSADEWESLLDRAVAEVDGHGFAVTPFRRHAELSSLLEPSGRGGLMVKDETGNVSGSPYIAPPVETKTKDRAPAFRVASRTFSEPITFTSASSFGSPMGGSFAPG